MLRPRIRSLRSQAVDCDSELTAIP
jgi:hypothetical protein